MSGRSVTTSGTSGLPTSSPDNNQPMDLAQKSHASRITDVTSAVKGGTTFVQFGSGQLIGSSGGSSKSSGIRNENMGVSGGVTLFSRPVSHGALNLASSNSGNSLNSFSSNVTVAARSHPASSVTVPSTSVLPSGYHIPKGAAAAAMTASRSQNLASIVRTTSQIIGSPTSTTLTSPRTSIISQRMVPISNSSWINRGTSTTAVLTTKATSSQVTGRVPISSGRSSQSPGMPVTTYHGGSVKSGSVVTGTIRPHGPSTVRVGAISEGAQKSGHAAKGITVPHSGSHSQKYIGSGATSSIRGVGNSTFITPGNAGTSSNTVYTPTSTLVTSLASSGTTITPHPGNRNQPLNTVRLTSAVTTVFTQASTQANSTSLGGICLTPASSGTIITQHSSSLARTHSVEQLSVKTPIVRTSHPSVQSHGIKGNTSGLPVGTHISISGPKVISQPTQVPTLALAQLSNVSGPKAPGAVITTQTGLGSTSFQSRTGPMVTPPLGRSGPTISMAKVIPQVKGSGNPCLSSSLPTNTAAQAPLTSVSSGVGSDSQSPHSNVFVHRTSHHAPMTTGTTVSQNERNAPTVTHYSIATPYYLDSNQNTFPVNASIVPANHYIPSSASSGSIRVGGNGAMNNVTTASEGSNHQSMSVPIIKTNSSPRPSILRKRSDIESGIPLKAAKNLSAALNIPLTSPPSPIRPDSRGNGNISSGSSTVSANSSPGLQSNEEDSGVPNVKMSNSGSRCELQSNENVPPSSCVISFPVTSRPLTTNAINEHNMATSNMERGVLCAQNSVPFSLSIPQVMEGVSPRKKPRKQQLMGNELHEVRSGEDDFGHHISKKIKKEPQLVRPIPPAPESEEEKDNCVDPPNSKPESWRETTPSPEPVMKRPHMSLMNSYRQTWKARHNHFYKHAEVRPKEEKKRTVNEIANQKLAMQRVNGWKVMHLLGQVEDLSDMEGDVKNRLEVILGAIEKRQQQRKPYKDFDKDVNRLSELVKANIQRSVIIKDQMAEAKAQMSKIFNHKENIVNILTKYGNTKRNLRKKDRL